MSARDERGESARDERVETAGEQGNRRAPLDAAFHELHGRSLHGFALLVTLGDRALAARLAADALAAGARQSVELRHPERAAAWLRARVVEHTRRPRWSSGLPAASRREALHAIGVGDIAYAGLAVLSPVERAAIVAADVEQLDSLDVATVLQRGEASARRLAERARRRYVSAASSAGSVGDGAPSGTLASRVAAAASRALS